MKEATVVAMMPEYPLRAAVFRILYFRTEDVVEAVKAAAKEFLGTPEGQEYLQQIVWDAFNWGDAAIAIPALILVKHGIYDIARLGDEPGELVITVGHDEHLAGPPCTEDAAGEKG